MFLIGRPNEAFLTGIYYICSGIYSAKQNGKPKRIYIETSPQRVPSDYKRGDGTSDCIAPMRYSTFVYKTLGPENALGYEHTLEASDDMPAHAKNIIAGSSITIPITDGRLNMGIWQGVYLCEFRNDSGGRRIVATVLGE